MARKIRTTLAPLILFIILLAPYLGLLRLVELPRDLNFLLWAQVIAFTCLQATLSTIVSLVLGATLGLGLWMHPSRAWLQRAKTGLWILSGLPALVWIFAVFSAYDIFAVIGSSLLSTVLVHSLMNVPLVALGSIVIFNERWSYYVNPLRVLGLRGSSIWARLLLPLVMRPFGLVGIVVFTFCFASFSVPLIFSDDGRLAIEVYIYQLALIDGRVGQALLIGLLQFFFLFSLSLFIGLIPNAAPQRASEQPLIKESLGLQFAAWVLLAILFGFVVFAFRWPNLNEILILAEELPPAVVRSVLVMSETMLFTALLCLIVSYLEQSSWWQTLLRGFAAPSMSLLGLGLFLWPGETEAVNLLKLSMGLSLFMFPATYKWLLESSIEAMRAQREQMRVLGLSGWTSARKILWPQLSQPMSQIVQLAGVWASVDFALSRMILDGPLTLGLLASELIGRYRLESGFWVIVLTLVISLAVSIGFAWAFRLVLRVRLSPIGEE